MPEAGQDEIADEVTSRDFVSDPTSSRLSVYLRCLNILACEGIRTISSKALARRFHLNSSQIRKDLAQLGELGIRGVGYDVCILRDHLIRALGLDRERRVVIVGAGNLGMALADYRGFNDGGFRTVAMLDSDPSKLGMQSRSGVPIEPLQELAQIVERDNVEIGIIAVPAEVAQDTCDRLLAAGVSAILNFAPVTLRCPNAVKVRNVDLRLSLEMLSFHLRRSEDGLSAPDYAADDFAMMDSEPLETGYDDRSLADGMASSGKGAPRPPKSS